MKTSVLKNDTLLVANIIAKCIEISQVELIKSLLIDQLTIQMQKNVVKFCYLKKDGNVRIAYGTINPQIAQDHINGRGCPRSYYNTQAYWDCEVGAWRSFRYENLIAVL